MAKIKNGLISGKIGDMVGYQVNGKQYLRRTPKRDAPPTEGELLNRFLLELVTEWLKPLREFVKIGFRGYTDTYEGFNGAFSVVYKQALQKDGYDSSIDPAKAQVSHGSLGNTEDFQVELLPGGQLNFSWIPKKGEDSSPRDRVMLLAYNIEAAQAEYETFGNKRYAGSDSLQLPASPGTYHLYAAFIAEDLSRQSVSQYLGTVQL